MKQIKSYWDGKYRQNMLNVYSKIVANVNMQIEKLSPDDQRKLNVLIRNNNVYTQHDINIMSENFREYPTLDKSKKGFKHFKDAIVIHALYDKADVGGKDRLHHWNITYHEQNRLHYKYKSNANPPRQDNKSYINYGNREGGINGIRFPSKKRKTAWKRFYKLFPRLKPKTDTNT